MMAYDVVHMRCVRVLVDMGAQVNTQDKVSGAIMYCVQCKAACTQSPQDLCAGVLFSACM